MTGELFWKEGGRRDPISKVSERSKGVSQEEMQETHPAEAGAHPACLGYNKEAGAVSAVSKGQLVGDTT